MARRKRRRTNPKPHSTITTVPISRLVPDDIDPATHAKLDKLVLTEIAAPEKSATDINGKASSNTDAQVSDSKDSAIPSIPVVLTMIMRNCPKLDQSIVDMAPKLLRVHNWLEPLVVDASNSGKFATIRRLKILRPIGVSVSSTDMPADDDETAKTPDGSVVEPDPALDTLSTTATRNTTPDPDVQTEPDDSSAQEKILVLGSSTPETPLRVYGKPKAARGPRTSNTTTPTGTPSPLGAQAASKSSGANPKVATGIKRNREGGPGAEPGESSMDMDMDVDWDSLGPHSPPLDNDDDGNTSTSTPGNFTSARTKTRHASPPLPSSSPIPISSQSDSSITTEQQQPRRNQRQRQLARRSESPPRSRPETETTTLAESESEPDSGAPPPTTTRTSHSHVYHDEGQDKAKPPHSNSSYPAVTVTQRRRDDALAAENIAALKYSLSETRELVQRAEKSLGMAEALLASLEVEVGNLLTGALP